MKKSIIITGLLSITPITHGFDQLAKTKEQISQAKKQISDTKGKLQTAYQDQKSSMLDNISKGMASIAEQKNMLDQAYPISEALRATLAAGVIMPVVQIIAVPALAIAGDIPEILRSLSKTVNSIQYTLNTLDSNVRPKIEYLNPATDSKGIYKQADVAIAAFADVETKIDEMLSLLQSLSGE